MPCPASSFLRSLCIYVLSHIFISGQLSGRALGYGLDDRWFESREGLGIFLFTTASRPALEPTQPPIQWVSGALSLGEKWPGREADHSPPFRAEVKNVFMVWCTVKWSTGTTLLLPHWSLHHCHKAIGFATDQRTTGKCCSSSLLLQLLQFSSFQAILLFDCLPCHEADAMKFTETAKSCNKTSMEPNICVVYFCKDYPRFSRFVQRWDSD
jgi:hypothetical protein